MFGLVVLFKIFFLEKQFWYHNYIVSEIEFPKVNPQLKLSGMFLDPSGDHLLLSFAARNVESTLQAELFYLNRKTTKIRPVSCSFCLLVKLM